MNLQKINMDCITKKLFCAIMLALVSIGGVYPQDATGDRNLPSDITHSTESTTDERFSGICEMLYTVSSMLV